MKIPERAWNNYRDTLHKIDERASDEMTAFLEKIGGYEGHEQEVVDFAYGLATKYGEAAGALACEMYDAIATAEGADVPPAVPAQTATYEETATAVRGSAKVSEEVIPNAVSRLTKMAGADTTLQNARRDGALCAWIPSGDTCAFCRMLASNGWRKASKQTLKGGHADHIHAHCDCQFAISFKGGEEYKDIYDPQALYDEYYDALQGGGNWRDALNRMRREDYAKMPQKEKDLLNARRRAEYAKKHGKVLEEKRDVVEEAFTPQTRLLQSLKDGGQIAFNPVQAYGSTPSEQAIIDKLGGGDKTNGSCSSVAFSYVGNKNGLDVTDFRGGGSQMIFSRSGNIEQIIKMVGGETATDNSDFKSANALLRLMEEGKEYYLGAGKHAAIVRLKDGHYEYLELQSATKNGWHPLDDSVLKNRFGCSKTHKIGRDKFQVPSYMAEVGSFKDNREFRELLGYINTQTDKQQKGAGGYAK